MSTKRPTLESRKKPDKLFGGEHAFRSSEKSQGWKRKLPGNKEKAVSASKEKNRRAEGESTKEA